jgi:SAM-dependent methyltransferase
LSRHGYVVHGIDRSPELVAEALRSADSAASSASFSVGDLLDDRLSRYDAVLCRGVLNDFLDESDRASVFAVFNRALRPSGVLVLDVREWARTAARKAREPIFRKTVATERGTLTFTSVTELNRGLWRRPVSAPMPSTSQPERLTGSWPWLNGRATGTLGQRRTPLRQSPGAEGYRLGLAHFQVRTPGFLS